MRTFLLFIAMLSASCTTEEVRYTKEQMFAKAKAADPTVTFILPRNMQEGVQCADYAEGCVAGHIVQVQKLNFIAVEFMTTAQAEYAAKKVRGFYSHNWLFDDVTGEPVLEEFVVKSLEAKKP